MTQTPSPGLAPTAKAGVRRLTAVMLRGLVRAARLALHVIGRPSPRLLHMDRDLADLPKGLDRPSRLPDHTHYNNAIEPARSPEPVQPTASEDPGASERRVAAACLELCERVGDNVSHVLLVPWVVRGGADLVAINYVRALSEQGRSTGVAVIATLNADSPRAGRLPEGVRFIEFGGLFDGLTPGEQETVLARMLVQKAPRVIHNINSDLGYRVFVASGPALRAASRIFACSFCFDLNAQGLVDGYCVRYFPQCFESFDGLFSENQAHLDWLCGTYGYARDRMSVHYQPVAGLETAAGPRRPTDAETRLQVLWAGRLDRQKRPDILLQIADACRDAPFVFHVYGAALLDATAYVAEFERRPNIEYHGAFDGMGSIPTGRMDVFLNTSQWDGLANILLEAIVAGLPVVTSRVGGAAELIRDGVTGFLVDPFDRVDGYVQHLQTLHANRDVIPAIVANAIALLRERHTWDTFVASVADAPGYFLAPGG